MIHVKQYIKEDLNQCLRMGAEIPYHKRWWEKEAFGTSGKILDQFIKMRFCEQ